MVNNNQRFQGCCPLTPIPKPPKQRCICPPGPRGPRGPQGEQGPQGPPGQLCPPPTQPNEPPECEQRRETFENGNPHLRFDLNLEYYFFNELRDFIGATQRCDTLGYRPITVQELELIRLDLEEAGLCTMLVWTTNNGIPTLAYFIPGFPVTIVPTPTIFCPAYFFCVTAID